MINVTTAPKENLEFVLEPRQPFNIKSDDSFDRAISNLLNIAHIFNPYLNLSSNLQAFLHPVYHTIQLLRDAAYFVYGVSVFIRKVLSGDFKGLYNVTFCMIELIDAAFIEVLNIAIAMVSLATRSIASILNFGYISTNINLHIYLLKTFYANDYSTSLLVSLKMVSLDYAKEVDININTRAFRLI